MRISPHLKRYLLSIFAVSTFIFSANVFAGAFQLWEQNAEGVGDYHAGAAAETDSAASIFYNAAIAAKIKHQQISFGGALIGLTANFSGNAYPAGYPGPSFSINDAPGDTSNIVPNFAYVLPFAKRWAFALSATSPFGLSSDYPDQSYVNLLATKTQLQTINLNPSIAYQINRIFSLGVGFDALYGSADYDADVFQPITDDLTGWAYGYNAGVLAQITRKTRVGLSYRSSLTIDASGESQSTDFSGNPIKRTAKTNFPLPATTILSLYQTVTPRLTVMASAFYTQWSVFRNLVITNIATPAGSGTINLLENYRNTWNFSVGGRYKLNDHFTLLAGFGHDDTPTRIMYRDIRLPDANHYAASLGLDIQPKPGFVWSMGWTHFFIPTVDINNSLSNNGSTPLAPTVSVGNIIGDVNVFATQFTIDF